MRLLVAALASELVAFDDDIDGFERLVTGPGKLQAAYALTRRLDAGGIDEIVVVGTAGSLDAAGAATAGGVHEIAAAIQHDVTDIDGIGDRFIDDAGAVASIRTLGATLVDMETYAYIWVAQRFGVPITVLKTVSDNAQDGAITDWRDAVAACSLTLRHEFRSRYGV